MSKSDLAPRGALIVVEGLDRAGKSTQVERLCQRWEKGQKRPSRSIRFPDRTTPIGENLNAYLTKNDSGQSLPLAAAHLLFSANRWEKAAELRELVDHGTTLIVDRYSYSGAVYTTAKAAIAPNDADRRMNLDWTWAPEIGLPAPDMLLFLDVSEDTAQQRGGYGAERYETVEMQSEVRRTFHDLLQRLESQQEAGTKILRIDANQTMDEVAKDMWSAVKELSQAVDSGHLPPLGQLRSISRESSSH